ncbi:MAG: hypothetical protein KatS3mg016_0470 [Fimbriimonadales bacterium]|nr:MAG: hypothetical protein KatS3mg016_0470 [Fimbriimonadales bacterium]
MTGGTDSRPVVAAWRGFGEQSFLAVFEVSEYSEEFLLLGKRVSQFCTGFTLTRRRWRGPSNCT